MAASIRGVRSTDRPTTTSGPTPAATRRRDSVSASASSSAYVHVCSPNSKATRWAEFNACRSINSIAVHPVDTRCGPVPQFSTVCGSTSELSSDQVAAPGTEEARGNRSPSSGFISPARPVPTYKPSSAVFRSPGPLPVLVEPGASLSPIKPPEPTPGISSPPVVWLSG